MELKYKGLGYRRAQSYSKVHFTETENTELNINANKVES